MYRDFYLNKVFFDSFLHCSYPLVGDLYIYIGKVKVIPNGFKKIYQYLVTFECKFEGEFVPVFEGIVNFISRKIHLHSVKYIFNTDLKQALFSSFRLLHLGLFLLLVILCFYGIAIFL